MFAKTAIMIFMLTLVPLSTQDEAAKRVETKLDAARTKYKATLEKERQVLLKEIEKKISRVKSDNKLNVEFQLELLKHLKEIRDKFASNPANIPISEFLEKPIEKFSAKVSKAQTTMGKAFDTAANGFRRPPINDLKRAEQIIKEKNSYFQGLSDLNPDAPVKAAFDPPLNDVNWIASSFDYVERNNNELIISAVPNGNYVLTKKTDWEHARIIIEATAAPGTEAYILLNAQYERGHWFGVTSKIEFKDGRVYAGGQRTGYRGNIGEQMDFAPGEYFKLRLRVHEGKVSSAINGRNTGNIAYGKSKTGENGAAGLVVKKGALKIRSIKVASTKK